MAHWNNFIHLPLVHRRAVYAMCRLIVPDFVELPEVRQMEWLAQEAVEYRHIRGWFVWEDSPPSTPPSSPAECLTLQCFEDL